MIVEQFQGNYLNSRNGYQSLGILSNDDGDCKENGKKAIGLDWQNNKFIYLSSIVFLPQSRLSLIFVKTA